MPEKLKVTLNQIGIRVIKGLVTFAAVYLIIFICINDVATDTQLGYVAIVAAVVGFLVGLINPTFVYDQVHF